MPEAQTTSIEVSIEVDAPPDEAFRIFTEDMASWWPPEHHLLSGTLDAMIVEPRAGGHIYDRNTDGDECHWGRVLAFDPPERFRFSWAINPQWQLETDMAKTSEVEVRFVAEGSQRTRVILEHRHLDRHGEGWEGMRQGVESPDGWKLGLERLRDRISGTADAGAVA
jgi:uncharacterized protein YndB with AHSA1/START domain